MSRLKKITLIIAFLLLAGGLYSYKSILEKNLHKDLTGKYVSVMPNFLERKIIFKEHDIKGAVFSHNGTKKLYLNTDFTQKYISYDINGDSTIYKGNWKMKNDSLILYFYEDKITIKFSRLKYSNKFYHIRDVVPCGDSLSVKDISVFKKLK
jgi:hypothetical protein